MSSDEVLQYKERLATLCAAKELTWEEQNTIFKCLVEADDLLQSPFSVWCEYTYWSNSWRDKWLKNHETFEHRDRVDALFFNVYTILAFPIPPPKPTWSKHLLDGCKLVYSFFWFILKTFLWPLYVVHQCISDMLSIKPRAMSDFVDLVILVGTIVGFFVYGFFWILSSIL